MMNCELRIEELVDRCVDRRLILSIVVMRMNIDSERIPRRFPRGGSKSIAAIVPNTFSLNC
jgi:hypothetical protein